MDIQKEAQKLESMSTKGEGCKALDELQSLSREDQLAVIKQLRNDAKQEGGNCYVDAEKDQLVFDTPFKAAHQNY